MKTILLIDDDEMIRAIFGTALERFGYRTIVAASGGEALELARKHLPELILSDINMPGIDGCTLLQSLRADRELATKQIVLMTGSRAEPMQRRSMELGADDFLLKPFSPEELQRCVTARFQRAEISRRVEDKVIRDLQATLDSTLPHEFFTPLAGILGLVEILKMDISQLPRSEVEEMLDDIQRSGLRLHRTLKNYLTVLELRNGEPKAPTPTLTLSPEATSHTIKTGAESAAQRHGRADDLRFALATCAVKSNPNEIAMMVEELVDNACAYSRKGSTVEIRLSSDGVLMIQDSGRGMTPEQLSQLGAFRQFDRRKFEQQGLGVGLELAQRLAGRQNAAFEISSQPGVGTLATIRFAV